jgi:hypothetical protein
VGAWASSRRSTAVRLATAAALLAGGACGASVLCIACGSPAKREAMALADAVDRFRHANGASSVAQAAAVAAVPCSDSGVCDARNACVQAVDPTARALALKDEVTLKLADLEAARLSPDSPEAQALPAKLEDASRLLREGHAKMGACETKLTDLRVTYAF